MSSYSIENLQDLSLMPEIYALAHDTAVESGLIAPQKSGMLDLNPHLDGIKQTTVLIAKCEGEIIGTNTLTLDGPNGIHTDTLFPAETNELRKKHVLSSSWRIATHKKYRSDIRLISDLLKTSMKTGREMGITDCLFIVNLRHAQTYIKALNAEIVATKKITLDKSLDRSVDVALMTANIHTAHQKFRDE